MPGPPPPPAPPSINHGDSSAGRSDLLNAIQKGTKLRKAVTNDRSSPAVSSTLMSKNKQSIGSGNNTINNATEKPPSQNNTIGQVNAKIPGGAVGIGALLANGMPQLRKTGRSLIGTKLATFINILFV